MNSEIIKINSHENDIQPNLSLIDISNLLQICQVLGLPSEIEPDNVGGIALWYDDFSLFFRRNLIILTKSNEQPVAFTSSQEVLEKLK